MSMWIRADEQEVYMNLAGDVCPEHIKTLENTLMERLQYGYRRIVLDINDVKKFADKGIMMLQSIHKLLLMRGGELIIKDKNGLAKQVVKAS